MATRKEAEPLKKVTLNIYEADHQILTDMYPGMGWSKAIRSLVRAHVLKSKRNEAPLPELTQEEIEA